MGAKLENIFISFVEEAVLNENYYGYIGGRIEVSYPRDHFPSEEIRFFTKNTEQFYEFRDLWDFREVDQSTLNKIKIFIQDNFNDDV